MVDLFKIHDQVKYEEMCNKESLGGPYFRLYNRTNYETKEVYKVVYGGKKILAIVKPLLVKYNIKYDQLVEDSK